MFACLVPSMLSFRGITKPTLCCHHKKGENEVALSARVVVTMFDKIRY